MCNVEPVYIACCFVRCLRGDEEKQPPTELVATFGRQKRKRRLPQWAIDELRRLLSLVMADAGKRSAARTGLS